jgi:hypothetical protein
MGLDTLDEFSPKDTDPVSLGDDAIRLTRSATKQSVGLEHYLDGVHKFPSGTTAARPAAGRAGRLYFNTDRKENQYDNGSAWFGVGDRLAQATILWHSTGFVIGSSGVPVEIPFDYVIDDPGGFASISYHQIIQPDNSIGMVSAYIEFTTGIGGYGAILAIQQYTGTTWYPLVQAYSQNVQFLNVNTVVDSRWGNPLRAVVTNASGNANLTIAPTALGASPRFGYALFGRTS